MAKTQPSHIDIVLTRQIRLRREHVSGDQPKAGEPTMRIGKIGERLLIESVTARQLIVDESAFKYDREKYEEILKTLPTQKKAA